MFVFYRKPVSGYTVRACTRVCVSPFATVIINRGQKLGLFLCPTLAVQQYVVVARLLARWLSVALNVTAQQDATM